MKIKPCRAYCHHCGKYLGLLGPGSMITKSCPECGSVLETKVGNKKLIQKTIKVGDKIEDKRKTTLIMNFLN